MTTRLIGVIGPGIVGMPMAALLARAELRRGADGGRVLVVQRASATSGWKVDAINAGRSPIGGVEPQLQEIVAEGVAGGRLGASHRVDDLADAYAVLVCVQTDKRGIGPDYDPLYEALDALALAFKRRRAGTPPPLVIIESTLAPSSMTTIVRERFASHGLVEGRDVRLGNSPNRVMPGRLVERVATSDKLVAALAADTAAEIAMLYRGIVTAGTVHVTNSLTAEIVKTLENAYRDVRIAFSAEVVRWCDARDVDFFALRDRVNAELHLEDAASKDPSVVPSGGLLVPTVGVGGHCLPKDGILLWWRRLEANDPAAARSLILESRHINDESPAATLALAERHLGPARGRRIAVLGAAYRFDSEDTRNSPSLSFVEVALAAGAKVRLHDPYVQPHDQNLVRRGLAPHFTNDLAAALADAEWIVIATGHQAYANDVPALLAKAPQAKGVVDASNLWRAAMLAGTGLGYCGIGRGTTPPDATLVRGVAAAFREVESAVSAEVDALAAYLSARYAPDAFSKADAREVRRLAATCVTGCSLPEPPASPLPPGDATVAPRLTRLAREAPDRR